MTKVNAIKRELSTMHTLEMLTNMLEQTSARTISQLRASILESRPFFQEVWRIYGILKQLTPPSPDVVHKHLVVCVAIDWGMPGGLLHKVVEEAISQHKQHDTDLLVAGKMAHPYFKKGIDTTIHYFSSPKKISLEDIQPIYEVVAKYAHVTVVYPKFETLSRQRVASVSLSIDDASRENAIAVTQQPQDHVNDIKAKQFIVDPNPQELANYLNEAIVGFTMYHYFLESVLAYNAAQMISMRNSHDNAKTESEKLTVRYNRARRELVDRKLRELYGSRAAHKGDGKKGSA